MILTTFAQEFEPIVVEPARSFPWVWIIGIAFAIFLFYLRKKMHARNNSEKKKKEDDEVKWIRERQRNYSWIIALVAFLLLFYLYCSKDQPPEIQPPSLFSEENIRQKEILEEPDIFGDDGGDIADEAISREEELPKKTDVSKDTAEQELAETKQVMVDLFKIMNKAQEKGKDIREARKIYGEANTIYYRGTLALKNDEYDRATQLAREAREMAASSRERVP